MAPKMKEAPVEADDEVDASNASKVQKKAKDGPGPTSGEKAAAKGDGPIAREDTPRKPLIDGGVRLVHWNVAGLNSLLEKDEKRDRLAAVIAAEKPDVLALSEHKISAEKHAGAEKRLREAVPGYTPHWAICTAKNGYSGVVCLVRDGVEIVGAPLIDTVCAGLKEGRTVSLELAHCWAVAAYVPNSGMKLERLDMRIDTWEPAMRTHLKTLAGQSAKPVVLFGDLNVGHLDADIWNVTAKHIPKSAGLTPKERAAFGTLLADGPYIDCFRQVGKRACALRARLVRARVCRRIAG